MPPQEEHKSPETSRDPIEIRQDASINIQEALIIAAEQSFPIGKSTLQRWAKAWADRGAASPVKSILVTNRVGSAYRLDREDFKAWLFDQEQNMRPGETLRDPTMSDETSRDITRSRQTSRGSERPRETSGEEPNSDAVQKLRDENMQLKIDVEVRKQLLNQAAGEITRQRDHIEGLLRENGALQSRVLQLAPPTNQDRQEQPPHPADRVREAENVQYPQNTVDNATEAGTATL
jgi:hypothetical protein